MKKIIEIILAIFIIFNIALIFTIYQKMQDPNNNCMLYYVKDIRFWIETWYLENLQPWAHISYTKRGIIEGTCNKCDCTEPLATYQCYVVEWIYNLTK